MRRIAVPLSVPLHLSLVAPGVRFVAYSETNAALAATARSLGWSNVWVTPSELHYLQIPLAATDPNPTRVEIPRHVWYFHVDVLKPDPRLDALLCRGGSAAGDARPPWNAGATAAHVCVRKWGETPTPLWGSQLADLEAMACAHGWQGRAWVSQGDMKRLGLFAQPWARHVVVRWRGKADLYNASQLTEPERVLRWPVDGATATLFARSRRAPFDAAIEAHGRSSGLFFEESTVEALQLTVRQGECPLRVVPTACPALRWYNSEDVAGAEALAQRLGRSGSPAAPTELVSGVAVANAATAAAMAAARRACGGAFPTQYWINARQMDKGGLTLRSPDALCVEQEATPRGASLYYSVDQLMSPADGFRLAGTAS